MLCELESESDHYESSSDNTSDNNKFDHSNQCVKCAGNTCMCEQDEFYKLQSQFEDLNLDKLQTQFEDLNFHMISSDNVIQLLKEVSDESLRKKILEMAYSKVSSSKPFEKSKKTEIMDSYLNPDSLQEVFTRLEKKGQDVKTKSTSLDDLKFVVENLKKIKIPSNRTK